ncbi:MAG: amidohydrolase family protein [Candidatus Dormibacteraeota bacterium]|uniref:Amidohydrolase family protein n=1 Tax=Candidatus Amunia macphersoniae TaxID=3127014 RepID=A0A934NFX5_9BACT|nr:amidohydrolase family protein [Candidatus Dormibacteraeota bacterium]
MTAWRVRAVLLPDGSEVEERWVSAGGWSEVPVGDAQDLPGRLALGGLVDAHSHVSFASGHAGPIALDRHGAEANLDRYAEDGVVLIRDAGGDPRIVLALPTVSPGRPRMVAAGRHLAPHGMYFEAVHLPAEPGEVVDVALAELAAGATWVKLVADFPPAAARAASPMAVAEPTYPLDVVADLVSAVHAAGGRIAAHVTTPVVTDLVRIGIDSVEHGPALDEETITAMAVMGTAWTPTLCALLSSSPDAPVERRRLVAERRERLSQLLPIAVRQGVPVLTGSDVVGSVPREVALLVRCGLEPADALRAATTSATRFLRLGAAVAPAAVVTYNADPRDDPEVLTQPAAVVIDGVRVR